VTAGPTPTATTDAVPTPGESTDRPRLQGVPLDPLTLPAAMDRVATAIDRDAHLRIATVNLNFLTLAARDRDFRTTLEVADLSVIDGRILLWLARLAGIHAPAQITGHDLVRECAALAARRGLPVLLLGGADGVAAAAARRLAALNPGLDATGIGGGTFDRDGIPAEPQALTARIEALAPRFIFVGLGAPKQERWLAASLTSLPPAVGIGVGGVLDTLAGRLPRAPRWMQRAGLESAFQLAIHPRRYARRYLRDDPPTLARTVAEALRQRVRA
jgi:N-acetylglucosaminyldiphosphoundecaprenol N-acetyl-beta-D-mannosaminyltransferase